MHKIRRKMILVRVDDQEHQEITRRATLAGYLHPEGGNRTGANVSAYLRDAGLKKRREG